MSTRTITQRISSLLLATLVLSIVCVSAPSFAQQRNEEAISQGKDWARELRLSTGLATSADLRHHTVIALTGGVGTSMYGTSGNLALGMFVTPNTMLEVEGSLFAEFEPNFREGAAVTVRGRWFVANSLYLQGGLRWRHYEINDSSLSTALAEGFGEGFGDGLGGGRGEEDDAVSVKSRYLVDDLAVELGLGNRWQWEHVTFGVTWFSVGAPVAVLGFTEELYTHTNGRSTTLAHRERAVKDKLINWDMRLLTLDVGVVF